MRLIFFNLKHRTSNGTDDIIQLHRQFITFSKATEFYNRSGRQIIMSVFVCVSLWLIANLRRIRIWIDALFLEQLQTGDFPGPVHRFHGDVGFVLVLADVDVAPVAH